MYVHRRVSVESVLIFWNELKIGNTPTREPKKIKWLITKINNK